MTEAPIPEELHLIRAKAGDWETTWQFLPIDGVESVPFVPADLAFPKDAAEEMLAAMKEAEKLLVEAIDQIHGRCYPDDSGDLQYVRSAIAKAKAALKGE